MITPAGAGGADKVGETFSLLHAVACHRNLASPNLWAERGSPMRGRASTAVL